MEREAPKIAMCNWRGFFFDLLHLSGIQIKIPISHTLERRLPPDKGISAEDKKEGIYVKS